MTFFQNLGILVLKILNIYEELKTGDLILFSDRLINIMMILIIIISYFLLIFFIYKLNMLP